MTIRSACLAPLLESAKRKERVRTAGITHVRWQVSAVGAPLRFANSPLGDSPSGTFLAATNQRSPNSVTYPLPQLGDCANPPSAWLLAFPPRGGPPHTNLAARAVFRLIWSGPRCLLPHDETPIPTCGTEPTTWKRRYTRPPTKQRTTKSRTAERHFTASDSEGGMALSRRPPRITGG
jgi:hypothetical protein